MGIVNVLDKQLADLIAAGEVVGRASSAVKELIENSIDAGAKNITVEIKGGGNTYMRVSDDASGIMRDDVETAFLRHATSKIKKSDDLGAIATLGFRGEALAAIAAVSKIELITKTQDEAFGTAIKLEGGRVLSKQDAGCPKGTTIVVRDLFYNTPARLKFIKKDTTEAAHILDIVQKYAFARSDIGFKLIKDSKEVLFCAGDGNLKNVIYEVYGRDFARELIAVEYENFGLKISGYITNPRYYKNNKNFQNFFINRRYIKSPLLSSALAEGYKGSLISERYPGCVLNISVPYNSVDVNVDPSKLTVKFSNERALYDCVYFAIKGALMGTRNQDVRPELVKRPVISDINGTQTVINVAKDSLSHIGRDKGQNSFSQTSLVSATENYAAGVLEDDGGGFDDKKAFKRVNVAPPPVDKTIDDNVLKKQSLLNEADTANIIGFKGAKAPDVFFDDTESKKDGEIGILSSVKSFDATAHKAPYGQILATQANVPKSKPVFLGEAFDTYILAQRGDEFYIIDKHAAHERIIYEQLKNRKIEGSQLLISPVVLTLSSLEYSAFLENREYFSDARFEIEDFGKNSVIIRQVPYDINISEIENMVCEILDDFVQNKNEVYDKVMDRLYMSVACKAAIKANNINSKAELSALLDTLFSNEHYKYCPHGRPTYIIMTKKSIEKQFGRI